MKYVILLILVVLLVLHKSKAQTASTQPPAKYYSSLIQEKLAAGTHPAPANPESALPGNSPLPKKVKELANDNKDHSNNRNGKLPGEAAVDVNEIASRNNKWVNRKNNR